MSCSVTALIYSSRGYQGQVQCKASTTSIRKARPTHRRVHPVSSQHFRRQIWIELTTHQATPTSTTKGSPKTKTDVNGNRIFGSYTRLPFDDQVTACAVAYTCTYGVGFDEVCDNQRSGITEIRNGQTVYRKAAGRVTKRSQTSWAAKRVGLVFLRDQNYNALTRPSAPKLPSMGHNSGCIFWWTKN